MVDFTTNLLLASLNADDLHLLAPHLKPIDFPLKKLLFEAGEEIPAVYFPFDAVISLVVTLASGDAIESAMVGRDGIVGAAAALDGKISLSRAIVQSAGSGYSCGLEALKSIAMQSPAMISLLVRHEQTLFAQAQQSEACNVKHTAEERLARWLLRAHDLSGRDMLNFTQEFLAEMLGVERTTVTLTANAYQTARIIKYSRGRIQIVNLDALRERACECYGAVKTHYNNLMQPYLGPTLAKAS
jgi:CRP-like cAMP-binding protein